MTEFGRDISCTKGLRTGRFVTGTRLLAEAIYRRLTTPRGTLLGGEEEAFYGLDLADLIGSTDTDSDAKTLPGRIRNELSKDERVEDVQVSVEEIEDGPARAFRIVIDVKSAAGPFSLQLAASAVSIDILGITEGS